MKIMYISSACYPRNIDDINKTSKKKLEISSIKFHNLLIEGLALNNIDVESVIGLPVSIKTNKKIFWRTNKILNNNVQYLQIPFINFPIIKNFIIGINIFSQILIWDKKNNKEDKKIIVDASYISVLPFIFLAKKLCKFELIGIVADIYDYMSNVNNNNGKNIIIVNIARRISHNIYKKIDKYVFLSKFMNEKINISNKEYLVIEGLVDKNISINFNEKVLGNNQNKIVMYAGKLSEKFGVKLLIEAFEKIELDNVELWIFGFGDLEKYILDKTSKNNRIKFFGMVSNDIVKKKELEATILINPRLSSEEFVKYSFPSKNLEYLVSGTPMIANKLPCIPEEYYQYMYLIEEENIEGIKRKLDEVLKKSNSELIEKGKEARKFVLENKNNVVQAKKLINFINNKKEKDNHDIK